jgi:NAD-dependent dihydropyrimidine dehydrogenase PreA subunit
LRIDPDVCVNCENCLPYCPMAAIKAGAAAPIIDQNECVECNICLNSRVCPSEALVMPELVYPRILRRDFSDPLRTHPKTNVPGRGTEEMKTNDVTGRFARGQAGIAVELGRPGVGTRFRDVERVARAMAEIGVTFEEKNPVTFLMTDKARGTLAQEVLGEKVLSAIVEFAVPIGKVAPVLRRLKEVAPTLDTVFSLDLACRVEPDGSVPTVELAEQAGFTPSINGKLNVGLGRPRAKED